MTDEQAACVPAMPADVAALVERLDDKWKHSEEDCYAAASAIKAQAAEIERLTKELGSCRRLYNDLYSGELAATVSRAEAAEAKLREAVEVMRMAKAEIDTADVAGARNAAGYLTDRALWATRAINTIDTFLAKLEGRSGV